MNELSPTQRMCLAAVRAHPGRRTPPALPGGIRTVRALMRRGLVERSPDGWAIFESDHRHEFKTTMSLDGCHWFSSMGRCYCGATVSSTGERNPREDPYSLLWMEDTTCSRCKQLRAGARVAPHALEIVASRKRLEAVE